MVRSDVMKTVLEFCQTVVTHYIKALNAIKDCRPPTKKQKSEMIKKIKPLFNEEIKMMEFTRSCGTIFMRALNHTNTVDEALEKMVKISKRHLTN